MARTWKATSPMSAASPITSVMTATHWAEWSSGSR